MRSQIMLAKAREDRRIRLEQEKRIEKLKDICGLISLNRADLEIEIAKISDFLNSVENIVIKYDEGNQNMVRWHTKELFKEIDKCTLIYLLSKQLENISDTAVFEFFCGIDFFNLAEELLEKGYKLERITYIWKAQSVIKNIKYQFERIWNCDNKNYQIAVLKGMIALF